MRTARYERSKPFLLTPEAERELCLLAYEGCARSQNTLILHLLPFLTQVTATYRLNEDLRDDCQSEAAAALIIAVRKFNPHRGFSLKSFTSWHVHAAIRTTLRRQSFISIPKNRWYAARRHRANNGSEENGQDLPTTVYFEDISQVAEQNHPAHGTDSPEYVASQSYLLEVIGEGLNRLPPFEKQVIAKRYGIGQEKPITSREMAAKLNCSRSAILKAEESAKRSLRHFFETKGLRSFVGGE